AQVNDNDFAEFVLQALENKEAKSQSMLDVYNRATLSFARWIVRQKTPDGEGQTGWVVEGRESAEIFKRLYGADDVPANRKYVSTPAFEKPDVADPPLIAKSTPEWVNRRMISESPTIDDAGQTPAASALSAK